jgi:hypothetical protein
MVRAMPKRKMREPEKRGTENARKKCNQLQPYHRPMAKNGLHEEEATVESGETSMDFR